MKKIKHDNENKICILNVNNVDKYKKFCIVFILVFVAMATDYAEVASF